MVKDIKVGLSQKQVAVSMIGPVAAYLGFLSRKKILVPAGKSLILVCSSFVI